MTHDEATPPPALVEKGACPVCGCEEVDHRDLWTCRCPAPAPGLKAVDPGQPYYAATPPALEAKVDQELRLQNDREWKAKVDHQKVRATAAEAALTHFQDEVWGAFQTWSMALGWGITGMQPECYAMMDASIDRMLSAEAEAERLKARVAELEKAIRKEARSLEMCADLMRDRGRYPSSHVAMADRVADSFGRACRRLRAALAQKGTTP